MGSARIRNCENWKVYDSESVRITELFENGANNAKWP